jgi:hypothetical protein
VTHATSVLPAATLPPAAARCCHDPCPGFERIVVFGDAVCAIVITLLVLPPTAESELRDESITFAHQLQELWPRIITFVVSFLVVGQFWLAHHRRFGRIAKFDNGLLLLNLIFLLTVSFMPFPAACCAGWCSFRRLGRSSAGRGPGPDRSGRASTHPSRSTLSGIGGYPR